MIFVNARAFRGTDSHNLLDRWPDRVAWLSFTTTYKTAGTAKLRGSHIRRRFLWAGLWVGKVHKLRNNPTFISQNHFLDSLRIAIRSNWPSNPNPTSSSCVFCFCRESQAGI